MTNVNVGATIGRLFIMAVNDRRYISWHYKKISIFDVRDWRLEVGFYGDFLEDLHLFQTSNIKLPTFV